MHIRAKLATVALALAGAAAGCASNEPPPAVIKAAPLPPPAPAPAVAAAPAVPPAPAAASAGPAPPGGIDPRAVNTLKRMCTYLTGLKQFSVRSKSTLEVVTADGQKLQFGGMSDTVVQRPNRLRSNRVGEMTDLEFFYDGQSAVLYSKDKKVYAMAPEPGTLDQMLDAVRTRLNLEPPGADLLYTDACEQMLADVTRAIDVGPATLNGAQTRHLAFRSPQTDWQIWIEDGDRPFPRKYLITSRDVQSQPQFGVELDNWNVSPAITDATFKFVPPPGVTKIDFLPPSQARVK
jgi:hypothetical protein